MINLQASKKGTGSDSMELFDFSEENPICTLPSTKYNSISKKRYPRLIVFSRASRETNCFSFNALFHELMITYSINGKFTVDVELIFRLPIFDSKPSALPTVSFLRIISKLSLLSKLDDCTDIIVLDWTIL